MQSQAEKQDHLEQLGHLSARMRRHSVRMTSEAGSGHATSSLSAADIVATLFFNHMRFDVKHPDNPRNDRFILSKGHAAPILYAAWAEAGAIPVGQLQTLRRFDSELEGHPTPRFPWVDVATGSLGQGLPIGIGMALAARRDGLDYRTYVLIGDGETAEGSVWEAAEIASYYKLDNLVAILDVNRLGQSQATMYGHDLEPYARRFEAFGWHTIKIDGHDLNQIQQAFEEAATVKGQPVAIIARTIKGKGVSFLEDKDGWHGKALEKGEQMDKALAELSRDGGGPRMEMRPPEDRDGVLVPERPAVTTASLPTPEYNLSDEVATRTAYGTALRKLGELDDRVIALDGDVKNSTRAKAFFNEFADRSFECFIAEQNMIGMAVGLQARGKIPFAATFACFLSRAFDIIRMAAISRANIKLCGSHAGISIGEDGPSQMGLEDIAMMRSIPDSVVLYPSDAVSAERAVELAARHPGIVYIRTTRPKTPVIYPNDAHFAIGGCSVLRSGPDDCVTVVGAGITTHEALKAHAALRKDGIAITVVDLYSVKPLDVETLVKCAAQTNHWIVTVEDHYAAGGIGEAVASAVNREGVCVDSLAVRELPRSGDPDRLLDAEGINARAICDAVRKLQSSGFQHGAA